VEDNYREIGGAFTRIHDSKLWKSRGYRTWTEYLKKRHGFTRQRAHQLMKAAAAFASTTVDVPKTERAARKRLSGNPSKPKTTWEEALANFKDSFKETTRRWKAEYPADYPEMLRQLNLHIDEFVWAESEEAEEQEVTP
jgi:hypothetical protein